MNSETIVIEISPKKGRAIRHHGVSPHQPKGGQHFDLPENMPEKTDLEQLLRELLDDAHKRIRLLEAQIEQLRSALLKVESGEEE